MAINTIIVSGNVGKDAVLRVTPNGKHIASFSIPAKTGYGENEKTSWLNCKMFGAMAEKLSSAVVKGAKVTVSGEFVIEEWTRQDGSTAQTPTILVRDIDLPLRGTFGNDKPRQRQVQSQQSSAPKQHSEPPMDFDDDIPFAPITLPFPRHTIHVI
ncbi:single-stranded DNA-binding protein [Klebsiella aerogenes]|jgi:single-strand DNA-binding protein|uniref:single-stranded DNA-binding protein n=1 Tax=Klebsiella aerogenes TaxID=548 RepID=UPI000F6DAAE0|nr:single-stranded DNA-binding protein [Klebsiella aerogenes]DAZ51734.1 MAG TPA: Single strand binding protein [Caudoviricetes sp.]UWC45759.1 single-stranded DNA-binding protein [Klebsiella aerogenes]WPR92707.1 single-stranded DNA-binding protein [Klebsiella aerogenes]VEI09147.1 single-strand binding protein [Klebsiella aerogenes]HCJ5307720.1 single-stranded DNA-binding protein [Klebsiella aerogenes]